MTPIAFHPRREQKSISNREEIASPHLRSFPTPYRCFYLLKNFIHRWALHRGSSGVILCWRDHFMRIGGFDEGLEVRENSELITRLMRYGRYKYIGDVAATTSMRRYQHCGFKSLGWLWLKLWFQSLFGDLHRRHYETVR